MERVQLMRFTILYLCQSSWLSVYRRSSVTASVTQMIWVNLWRQWSPDIAPIIPKRYFQNGALVRG